MLWHLCYTLLAAQDKKKKKWDTTYTTVASSCKQLSQCDLKAKDVNATVQQQEMKKKKSLY